MYDRLKEARERARYVRKLRARYQGNPAPVLVAAVPVPADARPGDAISVKQTGRDPHHHQLFGDKHTLAALAKVVWLPDD